MRVLTRELTSVKTKCAELERRAQAVPAPAVTSGPTLERADSTPASAPLATPAAPAAPAAPAPSVSAASAPVARSARVAGAESAKGKAELKEGRAS